MLHFTSPLQQKVDVEMESVAHSRLPLSFLIAAPIREVRYIGSIHARQLKYSGFIMI